MHYYTRHVGDYIKKTAHLTLLEHGVYARLIDVYCVTERPIPDRSKYRCIGARSRQEKEAVDLVLDEFFFLEGELWRQKRCDETIDDYSAICSRNKKNGKNGGRPKKTQSV